MKAGTYKHQDIPVEQSEPIQAEAIMARYRIVAARPKDEDSDLNAEFKTYKWIVTEEEELWQMQGWKSIHEISDLIRSGDEVRTGKIVNGKMKSGATVELELRIAFNETKYKISEMPKE